jgi:hypothetical protein
MVALPIRGSLSIPTNMVLTNVGNHLSLTRQGKSLTGLIRVVLDISEPDNWNNFCAVSEEEKITVASMRAMKLYYDSGFHLA